MGFESLSSGISKLDAVLGGGFPQGSVTAVLGGGHTMSDRLVYEALPIHNSKLLSLTRPPVAIERDFSQFHTDADVCDIVPLFGEDNLHRSLEDAFTDETEYVVIDGAEQLFDEPRASTLMQELVEYTIEAECVAVLSFSTPMSAVDTDVLSALNLCDVVITFEMIQDSGRLVNLATVTKHRYAKMTDPIKLLFTPHPKGDETNRID